VVFGRLRRKVNNESCVASDACFADALTKALSNVLLAVAERLPSPLPQVGVRVPADSEPFVGFSVIRLQKPVSVPVFVSTRVLGNAGTVILVADGTRRKVSYIRILLSEREVYEVDFYDENGKLLFANWSSPGLAYLFTPKFAEALRHKDDFTRELAWLKEALEVAEELKDSEELKQLRTHDLLDPSAKTSEIDATIYNVAKGVPSVDFFVRANNLVSGKIDKAGATIRFEDGRTGWVDIYFEEGKPKKVVIDPPNWIGIDAIRQITLQAINDEALKQTREAINDLLEGYKLMRTSLSYLS